MRIILPFLIESIKQKVLEQAGIKAISPGDCKLLSALVSDKTHKQISDTTLKRIYGFTFSKFLPSLYTLNTLSEYIGYKGWEDFSKHIQANSACNSNLKNEDEAFSIISQSLNVSHKTLQILANRSVVPFKLTVKRNLVADHLTIFAHAKETATVLAAPAGYGKTTSICHWAQEQLTAIAKGSGDVILFLSSKVLSSNPHVGSMNDWLKALLGISQQEAGLLELFNDNSFCDKKFYLVIDGFDKERFKPGDIELITDILLDVLALYRGYENFKVILTMRSSNWVSLRNRLKMENVADQWFSGFMQDDSQEINMQLFNAEEVKSLSRQINPTQYNIHSISPEVASLFSYPLFFQYYYQKHPQQFCLNNLDYFGIYDIISSYFLDKIYNARMATEKVLALKILMENGVVQNGTFVVDKLRVYEKMNGLWEAYNELIAIGFLREMNRSIEGGYFKYIEFSHQRLLAYSLARKLAYDNNNVYDEHLMNALSRDIDNVYRVPVLKWCIFNAIKVNQFSIFKHLIYVRLCAAEKIHLLKFLINLIQHKYLSVKGADPIQYSFCQEHQELFHYFFGIEFISPEYEEVLQQMLTLDLEDSSKVWIHTALGIIAIVQLNSSGMEKSITALRNIPQHAYNSLPINPLSCIEALYTYLKYGIVKKEALIQITHFYFNPPESHQFVEKHSSNNILYLLALSTLGISNNKYKLLRYIKVLEKGYLGVSNPDHAFQFFLNITKADSYFDLGKVEEGMIVYEKLKSEFAEHKHTYTSYMKICLDLVAVKTMAVSGRESDAHLIVEKLMQNSAKLKFNYIEAFILAAYLGMHGQDTTTPYYKEAYYKFIKLVRAGELNPQSFWLNYNSKSAVHN